jgi:hypothetical protein
MTTLYNPKVASLPTTEGGISVSSEWARVAADLPKYCLDKAHRFTRKLSQRALNLRWAEQSQNHPELWDRARNLVSSRQTLERLKDYGLLSGAITLSDLAQEYLGNVLSLGMLLEHLDKAGRLESAGGPGQHAFPLGHTPAVLPPS